MELPFLQVSTWQVESTSEIFNQIKTWEGKHIKSFRVTQALRKATVKSNKLLLERLEYQLRSSFDCLQNLPALKQDRNSNIHPSVKYLKCADKISLL